MGFRTDLREIIERALEEYSSEQINLVSKAAREAIAYRIATDVLQFLPSPEKDDTGSQVPINEDTCQFLWD